MTRRAVVVLIAEEDGAILPVAIMGFLLLFLMAILIADVGQAEKDRLGAANGTDAAAILHADVTARDLNVLAMTHVGLTQMFVVQATSANVLQALFDLARRAKKTRADIDARRRRICPEFRVPQAIAACHSYFLYKEWPATWVLVRIGLYHARYDPTGAFATSRDALTAFNAVGRWVRRSHSARVGAVAADLAEIDGMEAIHFHPACEPGPGCDRTASPSGGDLPVEDADVTSRLDMCHAAINGSDGIQRTKFRSHGYPDLRGPLTSAGSRRNNHARDYVSQETGLGDLFADFDRAYPIPNWFLGTSNSPLFRRRQTTSENEFTREFMPKWWIYCTTGETLAVNAFGMPLRGATPEPLRLKGQVAFSGLLPWGIGSLFAQTEHFQILAVGARGISGRVGPKWFRDLSDTQFAHAQAWTYNADGFDIFSQSWRTILTPATRMDDPTAVAEELRERAPEAFRRLHDVLMLGGDPAKWGGVNAH